MPFPAFVKTVYWMDMFRRFAIIFSLSSFVFAFSIHAASSVVINEIQTGAQDADDEFIELWNESDTAIALEDWSIQYKTATGATINKRNFEKGATISAQGYYLVATKAYSGSVPADLVQSSITLAKSGGNLYLVRNQKVVTSKDDSDIVDRVAWGTGDSAEENAATTPEAGQSIERTDGTDTNNNANDFTIRATPTPSNMKTSASAQPTITVAPASSATSTSTTTATSEKKTAPAKIKEEKADLTITELLPNPVGSDEREFIELQNTGTTSVALAGWRITNRLGQEYRFTEGTLAPKNYLSLWREKSKLAFQNEREEIRLLEPNKDRATETVKYTDALEGLSLMRNADDDLVWTTTPTPGETNRLVEKRRAPRVIFRSPKEGNVGELLSFDGSDSFDPENDALTFRWDFGDELGKAEKSEATYIYLQPGIFTITLIATDNEGFTTIATQKIKISGEDLLAPPVIASSLSTDKQAKGRGNLKTVSEKTTTSYQIASSFPQTRTPRNDRMRKPLASGTIRGVVTVPPGVLAKTFMYIACETPCAGQGVKVRMTKANWPILQNGDIIAVTGKVSITGGEESFLTKKEEIRMLGQRKTETPQAMSTSVLDDTAINQLITMTGEVTEKKSGILYLDDSAGEIPVQIKSSARLIAEGDNVAVTGILTKNEKGYLLKASEPITVIIKERVPKETMRIIRDSKSERKKYLITTFAALVAIAVRPMFLFVQKRRRKKEITQS